MPDIILRVQDLQKAFDGLPVLRGVSLDVTRGEVVVLIGPSGSGKSTLLRCLNGLEEPTGGRIFLDGIEVTGAKADLPRIRRHMGMVFQHLNL
ncbi:MAG TPA: ATP-binding cassette domain-containing protein, partial [Candidatus Baltobacteraceae bacterium]|nr:ATP-binding cassette domain-containing protein [Candidatus Baltobacteraceae bacterium]